MFDLTGKVAIVTGGSRGIGRACALTLAEQGADVAVGYRANREQAEEVVAEVRAMGRRALVFGGDVALAQTADQAVRRVIAELGGLDILALFAGERRDNFIGRTEEEDLDAVFAANYKGTFFFVKRALPELRDDGRVIVVGSAADQLGIQGQAAYGLTKAGLCSLMRVATREQAGRRGITFNAVVPGWIETDMTTGIHPRFLGWITGNIPIGRFGAPRDVAALVAFLASKEAGYITGQSINVNGGLVM